MDMEIWHWFLGRQPEAAILAALTQAGLRHYACESPPLHGPGIVFFDEINDRLFDLLREASSRGVERVIAIGLLPARIK